LAEKEPLENEEQGEGRKPYVDREIEEYRTLMDVPSTFEEGFNRRTIIGALFICLIMIPSSIYLGLVAGVGISAAAEWVTIILFTEVARRSFQKLSRQEVYILFYVAAALTTMVGSGRAGGPFANLIWNQYFASSPAAKGFGIAAGIPTWVVPPPDSAGIIHRTFMHADWLVPIGLLVLGHLIGRLQWVGLGFLLFRVTSDVEKLPFPFAPIAAQGATALAEHTQKRETWRWHIFSVGAVIGLAWSFFYLFIPILSGSVLSNPIQLIPIPFIDLTTRTEKVLPGWPTGIATDVTQILAGFIIPFWAVMGTAAASLIAMIVNPHLVRTGNMPHYEPGMDTIQTTFVAWQDYWLPAGIGVAVAIGLIGFWEVGKNLYMSKKAGQIARREETDTSGAARGDIPIWLCAVLYLFSVSTLLVICRILIPRFPTWWLIFFGFFYTPVMSYISARLTGLIGQGIAIPMVREISFILSGYRGVDIWFAPIPLGDMGPQAQFFRTVELTGTKMTSVIKAEILMFPLILITSFLFWQFIWRLQPIPSQAYPFAQKMWPLESMQQALWFTATSEDSRFFQDAVFRPDKVRVIGIWLGLAVGGYAVLASFRMPTMFIYGLIRGTGQMPHMIVLQLAGALLSRFYFERRYGRRQWKLWAPVLMAGFACGMGLMSMAGSALAMVIRSVKQFPY
jgi:hypothetical protein